MRKPRIANRAIQRIVVGTTQPAVGGRMIPTPLRVLYRIYRIWTSALFAPVQALTIWAAKRAARHTANAAVDAALEPARRVKRRVKRVVLASGLLAAGYFAGPPAYEAYKTLAPSPKTPMA